MGSSRWKNRSSHKVVTKENVSEKLSLFHWRYHSDIDNVVTESSDSDTKLEVINGNYGGNEEAYDGPYFEVYHDVIVKNPNSISGAE